MGVGGQILERGKLKNRAETGNASSPMHLLCFSPLGTEAVLLLHDLNNEVMQYRNRTYAESTKGTYRT